MRLCLYGAASSTIDQGYIEKVEVLGKTMAKRGHSLVFGGGANGLMGAAARGVHSENGHILGVIPKFFDDENVELVYKLCSNLIETDTMRERKQIMEDNADGFIVTPGGIGTFEEFFEILTLKQLRRHNKPIAIYNVNGYYNELEIAIKCAMEKNFIRERCTELYKITEDVDELFEYLERPSVDVHTLKELKDG